MTVASLINSVGRVVFLSVCLLLSGCFFSTYYVAYKIPLTPEDLAHLSWLGYSYNSAVYPAGLLGNVLIGAFALLLFTLGITRSQVVIGLMGALIGGCFWTMPSPFVTISALSGIYHNQVKLGCFIENSVECKKMLGLPRAPGDIALTDNGVYTPEAAAAYKKIEPQRADPFDKASKLLFGTVPGTAMFDSLFMLKDLPQLEAKVQAQRARVAELKAQRP